MNSLACEIILSIGQFFFSVDSLNLVVQHIEFSIYLFANIKFDNGYKYILSHYKDLVKILMNNPNVLWKTYPPKLWICLKVMRTKSYLCFSVSQMRSMGLIEWLKVNRIRFERINESTLGYCLLTAWLYQLEGSSSRQLFCRWSWLLHLLGLSSFSNTYVITLICKSILVALQIIFFSLKHKALKNKQTKPPRLFRAIYI